MYVVIGRTAEYEFNQSKALTDDREFFVGLAWMMRINLSRQMPELPSGLMAF